MDAAAVSGDGSSTPSSSTSGKRVPMFLREKIVEYYEYVYPRMQSADEAKS